MKKNLIFIVLIVALIVTTLITVVDRALVEKEAKSVEITLAYSDFEEMAEQSEHDLLWWFEQFKTLGVYSVSIEEETLQSLIDSGYEMELEVLHNIKQDTLWEMRYPRPFVKYIEAGEYDSSDVVLVSEDQTLKTFILDGLAAHYPESFYTLFEYGQQYVILFDGTDAELRYSKSYSMLNSDGKPIVNKQDIIGSDIYYYGIAFDESKLTTIIDSGLEVNLRPWNNMRFSDKLLDAYLETVDKFDIEPRMFIFAGKEVLGYPGDSQAVYEYMVENDIAAGLIETMVQRSNTNQLGIWSITEGMDYQAVRVLPIVGYIQKRFRAYNYEGGEEVENTIFRGVTERNLRVVYLRPYLIDDKTYVVDFDEYQQSFDRLSKRFDEHGIELGGFSLMPYNEDNMLSAIITGMGLIAVVLLTARFFFRLPLMAEYLLLALGSLCVAGALYVAPDTGRQLLALISAITISSIGAVLMIEFARDRFIDKQVFRTREILLKSIIITFAFGMLAMFGGLIISGLLSHSKYLLEMSYFRGVKISQMLPLAVFVVLYVLKFGYNRTADEIKNKEILPKDVFRFLNIEIKLSYLLTAAVGAAVLYVYMARSGHETTVQPSNIEMIFRNFLELKLLARPRLKEFMMAVPAMMLFVYISYKAYKPLIAIVGVPAMIMFTSIINTFCHLRTPIYLSVIRTLLAIGFGIVIGAVAIVLCDLLERFIKRVLKYKLAYNADDKKELGA